MLAQHGAEEPVQNGRTGMGELVRTDVPDQNIGQPDLDETWDTYHAFKVNSHAYSVRPSIDSKDYKNLSITCSDAAL